MIRAAIDRALLAVHGQPDAWETPRQAHRCDCDECSLPCSCDTPAPEPEFRWRPAPGYVLHPDLHRVTLTELDLELPHDAARVIPAPREPRMRPADPMRRKRLSRAAATAAFALVAFGLLMLWGSHLARAETTAVVLVGRP